MTRRKSKIFARGFDLKSAIQLYWVSKWHWYSKVLQLTVTVNNAGLSRGRTVVEGTYSDNSITLRTNLLAPFLLSKEFLPSMIKQNHGHIFNVSSMSAYIPPPGIADYAASKAGLIAFHEVCHITAHSLPSHVNLTLELCSVFPKSSEFRMHPRSAPHWLY